MRRVLAAFALVSLASCKQPTPADPMDAAASPQASAEPAPIANVTPTSDAATTALDAGPPPSPMRADRAVDPDAPVERVERSSKSDAGKELSSSRELTGYALRAVLRPSDVAGPPKAPEVNEKALELVRRKTESTLAIELSQTRARLVFVSDGFTLPEGTEIRARQDRYGHVLILPGETSYRVVAPGALRALLGERRLDVAPLSPAEVTPSGEGARRLSLRTRKAEVATRAAKATFEIASLPGAGEGGALLCRALLDLMNAPPSTPLCGQDDVPMHAELRWTTRGAITFDVIASGRRFDFSPQQLAAPPLSATFVRAPLPPRDAEVLLPRGDLAALRSGPVEVPPSPRDAGSPPPESGLVLSNASDELRFVWIDGVAMAWVAPGARAVVPALVRGRYVVQWRTFLGDAWAPPELVAVPGMSELGGADAGAK